MLMFRKKEPSASCAEIQEDVTHEAIASAFQGAMVSHLRSHVPGTNVNGQTLLAANFLNQFQELVMLLEALAIQPDRFSGDLQSWRPESYEEHFASSDLRDKALAIAAYRRAPEAVRAKFDAAVARLQGEALRLVASVGNALGGTGDVKLACDRATARLRKLIEEANTIANGAGFEKQGKTETKSDICNQMTLDSLFQPR